MGHRFHVVFIVCTLIAHTSAIVSESDQVYAFEGAPFSRICTFDGVKDLSKINFYSDKGERLGNSTDGHRLVYKKLDKGTTAVVAIIWNPINLKDAAEVESLLCRSSSRSMSYNINIIPISKQPTVSLIPKNAALIKDINFAFVCAVSMNWYDTWNKFVITWYHNDKKIDELGNSKYTIQLDSDSLYKIKTSRLTINNLTESDIGDYKCKAKIENGGRFTRSVFTKTAKLSDLSNNCIENRNCILCQLFSEGPLKDDCQQCVYNSILVPELPAGPTCTLIKENGSSLNVTTQIFGDVVYYFVSTLAEDFCRKDKNEPICSGRGVCILKECSCNKRENPNEVIYGQHCECDNFSCPRFNGLICGGQDRGVCNCGRCNCGADFGGDNCGSERCFPSSCIKSQGNLTCSGNGVCNCNECRCHSGFAGQFCDICVTCRDTCNLHKECVECQVYEATASENCFDKCNKHDVKNIKIVDLIPDDDYYCVVLRSKVNTHMKFSVKFIDGHKQIFVQREQGSVCSVGGRNYTVGDRFDKGCDKCTCLINGEIECDGNKCNLLVEGDILAPKTLKPEDIVSGSCLRISVKEEKLCKECNIPVLASVKIQNPVLEKQTIPFKLTLQNPDISKRYILEAVLNIGWCKKSGDGSGDWIRDGDYQNVNQIIFVPPPPGERLRVGLGVPITSYQKKLECPKDVPIVACLVNPCGRKACESNSKAVCRPSFCGGCFAKWYVDGEEVECKKHKCMEACPYNWDPKCGSDGKTYDNRCVFETEQCKNSDLFMVSETACRPLTECERKVKNARNVPGEYIPQCNEDGTYRREQCHHSIGYCWCVDTMIGNKIFGTRKNVKDGSKFVCSPPCLKPCNRLYEPVCGSDGRTYGNKCELENGRCSNPKLTQLSERPCPAQPEVLTDIDRIDCPGVCTREYSPQCGSDGKTYGNNCTFESEKRCKNKYLKLVHPGKCNECPPNVPVVACTIQPCAQKICLDDSEAICKANYCGGCKAEWFLKGKKMTCKKTKCQEGCPFDWSPMCGSNGITYPNECTFEVAQCKDPSIYHAGYGPCPEKTECQKRRANARGLPGEYMPQCVIDGSYELRQCHSSTGHCWCVESQNGREIIGTKKPAGSKVDCSSSCEKPCTREYKPVCGSNGVTYPNKCEFNNVQCKDKDLYIRHSFTCQDDIKPSQYLYTISGKISTSPAVKKSLPEGSCLTISVMEELYCDQPEGGKGGCTPETYGRKQIKKPKLKEDGSYEYSIKFTAKDEIPGMLVNAVLNVGWCRKLDGDRNSDWVNNGDYLDKWAFRVETDKKKYSYNLDLKIQEHVMLPGPPLSTCADKVAAAKRENGGRSLLGAYTPKCDIKGDYTNKQCHGSTGYCWCVDTKTGQQIEGTKTRGKLECGCTLDGKYYKPGENAYVECNKCFCTPSGGMGCTLIGCLPGFCYHEGKSFKNGESYKDDCNTCTCKTKKGSDNPGKFACTIKLCPKANCQAKRDAANTRGPLLGQFIPQCDEDTGKFKKHQCHGSTGYCWCVDSDTGSKIAGTEGKNRGPVNCGKCQLEKVAANNKGLLLGQFIPQCDEDTGKFKKHQCHGSTGYCWCVDSDTGSKIAGTEGKNRGPVNCGKCQLEKVAANNKGLLLGQFLPQCDADTGKYKNKQCHGSTGYCWCVNTETGAKISGTDKRGSLTCGCTLNGKYYKPGGFEYLDCNSCICSRDGSGNMGCTEIGCARGVCYHNGKSYKNGELYKDACNTCVCNVREDSKEIGKFACTLVSCPRGKCQVERDAANSRGPMPGLFIPQCDDDLGMYKKQQCHGSTGYCWCVNLETGAKIAGTDGKTRGPVKCDKVQVGTLSDKTTQELEGRIKFSPPIKSIPAGSCIRVTLQKDILCVTETCDNPFIYQNVDRDPKLNSDGTYKYSLKFKYAKKDLVRLSPGAVLNMGWCGSGDNWIRSGDYNMVVDHSYDIDDNDEYEKDLVIEKYISIVKKSGKCHNDRDAANKREPMPGLFVPQCDDDTGLYKNKQCHGSTGYCWCVNTETGAKIAGTDSRGQVTCGCTRNGVYHKVGGIVYEECNSCTCQASGSLLCTIMACPPGVCYHNGQSYKNGESYKDACNTCVCNVREDSKEIGKFACTLISCPRGKCQVEKDAANSRGPMPGLFIPQCDDDLGMYKKQQCHGSTGYCWCVNPETGAKIAGTDGKTRGPVNCDKVQVRTLSDKTTIELEGRIKFSPPIKSIPAGSCIRVTLQKEILCVTETCDNPFIYQNVDRDPKLNSDGTYKYGVKFGYVKKDLVRVSPGAVLNMGWCGSGDNWIRSGDYNMVVDHSYDIDDNDEYEKDLVIEKYISIVKKSGKCHKDRDAANKREPMPGLFVPQCDDDTGLYKNKQCHGSTGYCWCVNTETGAKIAGTDSRGQVTCGCTRNGVYHKVSGIVYEECNSCTCQASGSLLCTTMACPPGVCYHKGKTYKNGESFKYDCNTCSCKVNDKDKVGYAVCTKKLCSNEGDCVKLCNRMYKPVCGSDGRTYPNECEFNNVKCKDPSLTIKNYFTCQDDTKEYYITGKIKLLPKAPSSIPSGSCLRMTIKEDRQCDEPGEDAGEGSIPCNIRVLGAETIKNPILKANGEIEYKIKFNPENRFPVTLDATLNMGWCKTQNDWIRNGDFVMATANSVHLKENKYAYNVDFSIEQYVKKAPTCAERVAAAKQKNGGRPLVGAYTPQCDDNTGDYTNKQCRGSTGYCWCVDTKTGDEIKGTRKRGAFDCGCVHNEKYYKPKETFYDECNTCTCQATGLLLCTLEGCREGVCYNEGKEYENGQSYKDDCNTCTCSVPQGARIGSFGCTEKFCIRDLGCVKPCSRIYKPVCSSNGRTYPNECEFNNEKCKDPSLTIKNYFTCQNDLDKNIIKIYGKVQFLPSLPKPLPSGSCLKMHVTEEIVCTFPQCEIPKYADFTDNMPKLNPDGTYSYELRVKKVKHFHRLLVHGNMLIGHCGSFKSGDYHMDTAHSVEYKRNANEYEKDVKLEQYISSKDKETAKRGCFLERAKANNRANLLGQFVPECDENTGNYKNRQCHRSSGYCWCVNTENGAKIAGTDTRGLVECGCTHEGVYYKPGSRIYQQCNSCGCSTNGFFACTRKACPKGVCYYNGQMKQGGERFLDEEDCNTCFCAVADKNKYGKVGCTLKLCPPKHRLSFVTGKIILPASASFNPEKSCLSVRIHEARKCQGLNCKPVIVESFVQKGVKLEIPNTIAYKMPFDGKRGLPYIILATLNVNWCRSGDDWIRPGDYHSVISPSFSGPDKPGKQYKIDINLQHYKSKPLNVDPESEVKCPPNTPRPGCTFEPCAKLLCDDYPNAVCKNNYCGVCAAKFFVDGKEVECKKTKCQLGCPLDYEPHCGSDNTTYPNECTFKVGQCENNEMQLVNKGVCYDENITPCQNALRAIANGPLLIGRFEPQCADDGSYKNVQCHGSSGYCWCVDKDGVKIKGTEKGPTEGRPNCYKDKPMHCLRACTFEYDPVCASNGQTIDNECVFKYEQCLNNKLTMVKRGQCNECPKAVPMVTCFANPCDVSTCPAYPNARCEGNYCGGCNADFYVDNKKVNCMKGPEARSFDTRVEAKTTTTASCSMVCPALYAPVCGSDGKTHSNDCVMKAEACVKNSVIFKVHDGECGKCQKVCTFEYDPQCGSDGKIYANKCLMRLKVCESGGKVAWSYSGECGNPTCPQNCDSAKNEEICGTDGKTYGSMCALQQKSCDTGSLVKFKHYGKCVKCSALCNRQWDPYCGTDNQTYGNECMMKYGTCKSGGRVQIKYRGECNKPSCPLKCPSLRDRVCGTDGKTYGNLCMLQKATCSSPKVLLKHLGACANRCRFYNRCRFRYRPVCGTDGKTYVNHCELRKVICVSNGKVSKAYNGKCKKCDKPLSNCYRDPCDGASCPKYPLARCVSNYCGGCNADFYYGGRKISNCGKECSKACTKEYFPLCGNDGHTYSNKCLLNYASCKSNGRVKMAYVGPCKTTYY